MSGLDYEFGDPWESLDRAWEDGYANNSTGSVKHRWTSNSRYNVQNLSRRQPMGDMADDIEALAIMYEDVLLGNDLAERDFERDIWVAADGRRTHVRKLETSHLRNIIRYIKNGGEAYGLANKWLSKLEGELERRERNAMVVPRG